MLKLTPIFMIKFLTKNRIFVICTLLLLAASTSCTEVDNELGVDFIPGNQNGPVQIDSSFTVSSYTVTTEKFPTSTIGSCWIGSYNDPIFGSILASVAGQIFPASLTQFKEKVSLAKDNFVSAYFVFKLTRGVGDSLAEQNFKLYQLLKPLADTITYYSNYDINSNKEKYNIDSLNESYNRKTNGFVKVLLSKKFVANLLYTDTAKLKSYDDFLNVVKGIYVESQVVSTKGSLNLANFNDSATIVVNYKLKKVNEPTVDSMAYLNFTMGKSASKVGVINHSYNGSALGVNSTTPQMFTYLQGLGGLRTKVVFDKESIAKWKDKGYNIHRVEMILEAEFPNNILNYDRLPAAITPYYQKNDTTLLFIQDMEIFKNVATNAYYNRSKRNYSINITNYFKESMRNTERPKELFLYAGVPSGLTSDNPYYMNYAELPVEFLNLPTQGILKGLHNGKSQIKIVITYSK